MPLILNITVKFLSLILLHSFLYVQNLHLNSLGSELNLDDITCFHADGRLCRLIIHQHASCVACLIGYGSALDKAGNFQKLVQSHGLFINLIL